MAGICKRRSAAFKATVALEVAKQTRTVAELAEAYRVHPVHLSRRQSLHHPPRKGKTPWRIAAVARFSRSDQLSFGNVGPTRARPAKRADHSEAPWTSSGRLDGGSGQDDEGEASEAVGKIGATSVNPVPRPAIAAPSGIHGNGRVGGDIPESSDQPERTASRAARLDS
jgi:hypothetical protein